MKVHAVVLQKSDSLLLEALYLYILETSAKELRTFTAETSERFEPEMQMDDFAGSTGLRQGVAHGNMRDMVVWYT
jgi:hypothetical protein